MKIKAYAKPIILGELEPRLMKPITKDQLLNLQSPSTKWCLTHEPTVPFVATTDPVAVRDAKSLDESVGVRPIDWPEWVKYFAQRQERKFSGYYRIDATALIGEYQDSSVSFAAKERASQAFRFTPPAEITKAQMEKAVGLTEYKSERVTEWRKLSYFEALIHRLKGGEVRRE